METPRGPQGHRPTSASQDASALGGQVNGRGVAPRARAGSESGGKGGKGTRRGYERADLAEVSKLGAVAWGALPAHRIDPHDLNPWHFDGPTDVGGGFVF
jgi:hypothetical protein